MTYPNEQLPAGRPLKTTPAYDAMTAAGCQWGNRWGLEIPLYFAPEGFKEKPTLKRSNAFDIVGAECREVREGVGLLDIAPFSRYEVTGPEAEPGSTGCWPRACRSRDAHGWRRCCPRRQAQGRPDRDQLGRRDLLDRGLLLPSRSGICAGSPTTRAKARRCATFPTTWSASRCRGRRRARCWRA